MGRKVKRYGVEFSIGENLWGSKVKAYGGKGEYLWGNGESLWGKPFLEYLFI
ncbi:TPA: hypothetical protein ACQT1M_003820 [Pseudomonas aeruginosa]|nr:hypothetical protein [Pseudomonas aeruginosa]